MCPSLPQNIGKETAHLPLDKEQQLSKDKEQAAEPKDQDMEQPIADLEEKPWTKDHKLGQLQAQNEELDTVKKKLQKSVQKLISVIAGEHHTKDQGLIKHLCEIAQNMTTMIQNIQDTNSELVNISADVLAAIPPQTVTTTAGHGLACTL